MSLQVPVAGEKELLDKMLKSNSLSDSNGYVLNLYQTNVTPGSASVPGDFVAATFTSYTAVTLTRSGWNAAQTYGASAVASYGSGPLSWTCGASGATIYGYYVVSQTSPTTLLWAEKFDVPRVMATGDILNLQPQFSLSTAT